MSEGKAYVPSTYEVCRLVNKKCNEKNIRFKLRNYIMKSRIRTKCFVKDEKEIKKIVSNILFDFCLLF
jgi:hypothetical protein